ncbi:MAG: putative short chain dehydrogenase, partial [Nocardioidaceae bacterium]|nr:putative short chain dehydrogenase [Nocardioidaceae bacterium]
VESVTGRYFDDCNEAPAWTPGSLGRVAPHAVDPQAAARLWELSDSVVG